MVSNFNLFDEHAQDVDYRYNTRSRGAEDLEGRRLVENFVVYYQKKRLNKLKKIVSAAVFFRVCPFPIRLCRNRSRLLKHNVHPFLACDYIAKGVESGMATAGVLRMLCAAV